MDRTSTSKLDDMLNVQKSVSDKTGLGFVEIGSSSVVNTLKFVLASSTSVVHPSVSKPKNFNQSERKKNHKPQWFCHFYGGAGHTRPNCFRLQALK